MFRDENGILRWKYQAKKSFETGYESVEEQLAKYNCDMYENASNEEKEKLIDEVFDIIRSINVFPGVWYYTHQDIIEEIQYCKEKNIPIFDGKVFDKRPTLGNELLKFLFPNFFLIQCKEDKNNSLYERFYDDHKLKRAIKFCFEFKKKIKTPCSIRYIQDALKMIGGNTGNTYLPMKVRMLLEYFMPNGGNYFDFSCGFGGRLLGAVTSNTSSKINYYGFDPNTETYNNLLSLKKYAEEALNLENNQINLYNQGSEEEIPNELIEQMDFAFSCPPYFNLEKYSKEKTQCYNKYPILDDWLNKYVTLTIKNVYKVLKKGSLYAVNISDFKVGNENVKFVEDWIKISLDCGFKLIKEIPIKMGRSRPNNKSEQGIYIPKMESIYVFKKQ